MKKYLKKISIILILNLSYITFISYITNCSTYNDSYIKNPVMPKYLYVISEDAMNKEEQTMISTLQGVISSKSEHQIYIISPSEPDYKIWLDDLKSNYNVKVKNIGDPWELINKFKPYVGGYILYSNSNPPSINNACTLASLKDSIVIDESLEDKINSLGITSLIEDCKNTDTYWAFNNLWDSGLNHSIVIEISPEHSIALRDYAIMSKSLVFYEDDINNTSLREKIFKSMKKNSHCLGWGPDENINVRIASKFGVDVIAADWSYNLSSLSSYPSNTYTQKNINNFSNEDGLHYVTFIMSDGDNQQWYLGSNYGSKNWYGSSERSDLNLGWSISPSLYYLAPTIFNKYYEKASLKEFNDYFLVPPSGNGYMYPSKFPINKLSSYTKLLSKYMKKVNQNYVLIIDEDSFHEKTLWDKYTKHSNINGLFYLNYKKHNDYNGEIIWSNNKPIVSCRDILWKGLEDENQLVENINNRINLGYTNIKDPYSYTFVYVHAWSKNIINVQEAIDKLKENPKAKVVSPDIFMKLIKENISS